MMAHDDAQPIDHAAETADLPSPRPEAAPRDHDIPPSIPEKIGHYRIRTYIGAGGMAQVFLAVQERPHRRVALKIMKSGVTSRSALRRFEFESQILARLRHPNIAQVFEAGTHTAPDGDVPYFAMEYIASARPITDYARAKNLTTSQRLQLFVKVCDAVHHGHQKGVIHRDLKPGNILVDAAGEPKVIDFGVARSTDSDLAVTTLQTDVGQLIGTLQYMSPEQCEADVDDLDIRSDVYALGVVLFELLTDRLPYDVGAVALYEAARVIREDPPIRPSTINRTLRGDIETLTLKTLEKERDRRYQSATELAQDIARYLAGDALVARPPSLIYQLNVFARRHRALCAAAASIFLVLAVGVVASTTLYLHARSERDRAVAMSEFFKQVVGAVDPFGCLDSERPLRIDVRDVTLNCVLQNADALIEQHLAGRHELEAEVRRALAQAFFNLGEFKRAEHQAEVALTISRQTWGERDIRTFRAMFWHGMALNFQGHPGVVDQARQAHDAVLASLGPRHRCAEEACWSLAYALLNDGQLLQAEQLLREAVANPVGHEDRDRERHVWLSYLLALVELELGRFTESETIAHDAWKNNLESDSVAAPWADLIRARALREQGRIDEALPLMRQGIARIQEDLGENHPLLLHAKSWRGDLLTAAGEPEAALELLGNLSGKQRDLYGSDHVYLPATLLYLGRAMNQNLWFAQAEQILGPPARSLSGTAALRNPTALDLVAQYAVALHGLGRSNEAAAMLRDVVETADRRFNAGHFRLPEHRRHLGRSLMTLGSFDDAEHQLLQAYQTEKTIRGHRHANACAVAADLVELYRLTGNSEEVAAWSARLPTTPSEAGGD